MDSRRSSACSKGSSGPPGIAVPPLSFLAAISSSRPDPLDAGVRGAAREIERQRGPHGEPVGAPHQSTVGHARDAKSPLENPLRRERAQAVPGAGETQTAVAEPTPDEHRQARGQTLDLLPLAAQGLGPTPQRVSPRRALEPCARVLETPGERAPQSVAGEI